MNITKLSLGMMETNCYIISDESTCDAIIVDPGAEPERVIHTCDSYGFHITAILLTHGHFDHIGGVKKLKEHYDVPILIHEQDAPMLTDASRNLSFMNPTPVTALSASRYLEEGEIIPIGKSQMTVYHTPGHSFGSICLYGEGVLIAGDTLFRESMGRYDFGSLMDILKSLARLETLPDDTKVYPGHGPETTIGHEKKYNPYMR